METPFRGYPKIPRLFRPVVITEKIDGTNGVIAIFDDGSLRAGCRTHWLTPQNDNFGFAAWVEANKDALLPMGPGYHYGEWWGAGIQRRYGLKEKRFSLFDAASCVPSCVSVVPVLYEGPLFYTNQDGIQCAVHTVLNDLRRRGSSAAPGFMQPEGIVIFHTGSRQRFKVTFEGDETGKGE